MGGFNTSKFLPTQMPDFAKQFCLRHARFLDMVLPPYYVYMKLKEGGGLEEPQDGTPPIHEKASSAYVDVRKLNQDLGDHDPYIGNIKGTKGTNRQTATLII